MTKSRLRHKYNKTKTSENWNAYKKQRNLCTSLRRKNIKRQFENLTFEDQSGNRSFWKAIKPYLTN